MSDRVYLRFLREATVPARLHCTATRFLTHSGNKSRLSSSAESPDFPLRPRVLLRDTFAAPVTRVMGSEVPGFSFRRQGADVEGVVSIDHGALRIQPLANPGWGRSGIAYGPFRRTPGLAVAVLVSNGHNLSQSYLLNSWVRQAGRWLKGGETESLAMRLVHWLGHKPRTTALRKLRIWKASSGSAAGRPVVKESLAVGFFPGSELKDPLASGNAVVIHANEAFDSGEVWTRVGEGGHASSCQSLQNLPMYYVVVLRSQGAVYYAASFPGSHGVGPYPSMRPIAIDWASDNAEVFAAVHQAVLGEIGFTMDTRVHGVAVAELADFAGAFAGAHAADSLRGNGRLSDTAAQIGGVWQGAGFERSPGGTLPWAPEALSFMDPGVPTSLLHAFIQPTAASRPTGLAFRVLDSDNFWAFLADANGCRLRIRESGQWRTVADGVPPLVAGRPNSIQIVDHGSEFTITVSGGMALGRRFVDPRHNHATGVGIYAAAPGEAALITDFEAHPREVSIPPDLNLGPPPAPSVPEGVQVLIRDDFAGPPSDLAGHRTTLGSHTWRKDFGKGTFEITGDGSARVVASIGEPNPGRTFYTVEWADPGFADIDLEMTPPGTKRGEFHRGRSGVVFWQDARNYFIVNLWLHDNLPTASISTFFFINGFDDLYDAIWTCIGPDRITWGKPARLRYTYDGNQFLVRVNDEPVLQRALTDVYPHLSKLKINRIGLLSNWEWGTDTGTIFKDFTARGRAKS